MAIKRTMTIDENETTIKMYFKPSNTIFGVYKEVNDVLKIAYEDETDTDIAARVLNYYAETMKYLKKLIECPSVLRDAPRKIEEDIR